MNHRILTVFTMATGIVNYPTLQDGNNERQDNRQETTDREFVFTTDLPEYCVELGHLCDA